MQRREFITKSALSLVLAGIGAGASSALFAADARPQPRRTAAPSGSKPTMAFVIYPGMTPLDIIGPATALGGEAFNVEFVWRDRQPVQGEVAQVQFVPTTTFRALKKVDVLCITGTGDPYAHLDNTEMLDWLHNVGGNAEWITSVCTGSILLGAAGLLQGYKATTHWSMMDDLKPYGAIPVDDRVVIDRNRVTGGGVTAGIDFGLTLRERLLGRESAEFAQLKMQYDPHPPVNSGTPRQAAPALVKKTRDVIFGQVQAHTPDWKQRVSHSAARMQRYAKS